MTIDCVGYQPDRKIFRDRPGRGPQPDVEVMSVSESTSADDELDRANRAYWLVLDMAARLDHVAPLGADESFAIADLSDDEWADFMLAARG